MGCHRSCTSALARAFNLMGLALPREVLGAGRGNPLGHWEPAALTRLNERMLEDLDRSWFDPKPLPQGWRGRARNDQDEAASLWQGERSSTGGVVLKDPRLSRLAGLWRAVLPANAMAIIACRNPYEVASSLKSRNGFDKQHGLLLWETYMLEAEAATRGMRRMLVHSHELVQDPRAVLAEAATFLGIACEGTGFDAAVASIDPRQVHHQETVQSLGARAKVPQFIKDLYDVLLAPAGLADEARFDQLRDSWEERWRGVSPGAAPSPHALNRPETYYSRSLRAAQSGDVEAALANARKAAGLAPQSSTYQVQTGRLLARMGALAEAIAALRRAVTCDPKDRMARNHLLSVLVAARRGQEALAEARMAVKAFPLDAPLLLLAASVMANNKARDDALLAIAQAQGLAGPSYKASLLLAAVLRQAGHLAAAAGHARAALAQAEGQPALAVSAARLLVKCDPSEEAKAMLARLLAQAAPA